MRYLRATRSLVGIAATIAFSSCGGGGGGGGAPPSVPAISNLTFSPSGAYVDSGTGNTVQVIGHVEFSTPGSALSSARVTVLDSKGNTVAASTAPIQGAGAGASGLLQAAPAPPLPGE